MGIKTYQRICVFTGVLSLKNLPTTWGLRPIGDFQSEANATPLKNLPTTWGLRRQMFG